MAEAVLIDHSDFIRRYKAGELMVAVDKMKAGDFVLSPLADRSKKPAHYFWTWFGVILAVPATIVLFFVNWKLAIACFLAGIVVSGAARKTAGQFVLQNMLQDPVFCSYVLVHKGARISDDNGTEYSVT